MKKLLFLILLTIPLISFGQISSNAPATVPASGGTYSIQFNIMGGTWYNTRSASVDYGGITFPFTGSEITSGAGQGYYFTVDPNHSCQRDLKIILQDVTGSNPTTTFTITQLSTVPAISTGTITGPNTVCAGSVNTFTIATSAGSYTTWVTNAASSTILGNVVAPIVVQWTDGNLNSSSISGGIMKAVFTSSGFIISARENGCSAIVYDTLNVNVNNYSDSVRITPTVDNVAYGTPITFTATGTIQNPIFYAWLIINGVSTTVVAGGSKTYTYSNYTNGDIVYVDMYDPNIICGNQDFYSNKVAIPNSTLTSIESNIESTQFKIYPNPFTGSFQVENATINTLTDLLGNQIPFTRSEDRYYVDYKGLLFVNTDKGTVKITQY